MSFIQDGSIPPLPNPLSSDISTGEGISSSSLPPPTPSSDVLSSEEGTSTGEGTSSKLRSVEEVVASCTGTDIASLKALTRELAREAVFGKDVLSRNSLSG